MNLRKRKSQIPVNGPCFAFKIIGRYLPNSPDIQGTGATDPCLRPHLNLERPVEFSAALKLILNTVRATYNSFALI